MLTNSSHSGHIGSKIYFDSSFRQHVNHGIHSVGTELILTELTIENY